MTKKSIKVLSFVLLLVLMVGIMSLSAFAAEGDVQVTIQMTRYCPSMSLTPKAGGESIDVGEPSDMLYTFNAAPGDYILTGYDTDGKTVTGTIGVTISADGENSFNIAAVRVSQGNSSTLEYGVDWELAVTSLKDKNGVERTDVSTGRLS